MITYKVTVDDGTRCWYLNGECHREDGPAIERADGGKEWFLNGKRHREDGPAIEWAGGKHWYLNGSLHREDGPAIEWANGIKSWWINGRLLTEEEWKKKVSSVKELTVSEISKILGYEVKIVKENLK